MRCLTLGLPDMQKKPQTRKALHNPQNNMPRASVSQTRVRAQTRRSKSKREKEQSTFERVPRHIVSTNILSPPSPLKPHRPKAPGQSQIWWGSGATTTWGEKNLFFGVFISGVQM